MELEVTFVDRGANVYDLKRAIGSFLHSDDFYNPSDAKARPVNFKVTLNEGPNGIQHNGTAVLIVPTQRIGDKFMKLIYGKGKAVRLKGRKLGFRKTGQKPDYKISQSLDKTPYLNPDIEEARDDKLSKLDVALWVDKVQFGVLYRNPDDPPHISRRFSTEYELAPRDRGAGLIFIEYDHKLIRLQLGDPTKEQDAYNIAISFSNLRRLAIGNDFGNPFICFDMRTPPVFQLEKFNRTFTGDQYQDNRKFRQRISALNPSHELVAPYAHQLRVVLHHDDDIAKFVELCRIAELPRPFRANVEASQQEFFGRRVQHQIKKILLGFEWNVAFQIESLLRNGLVNTGELLNNLLEPIRELTEREPTTAADTLRLYTEALRAKDRAESSLDCLIRVLTQEAGPRRPKLPSGTFLCHHVTVTPSRILLEGPYAVQSNRVIRKYLEYQDNFIRVDFRDEDRLQYRWEQDVDGASLLQSRVGGILKNGIEIAGRFFEFLAYSNSALRQHAVWFVRPFNGPNGFIDAHVIRSELGDFSRLLKNPSKYAARIAQAFTATDPSVSITRDQWEEMDDMGKDPYWFTDGVGTISKQLGDMIWDALCAERDEHYRKQVQPSAYQIRFLGYKGMVVVDEQLEGIKMRLRPTMNKFEGPQEERADIEIARAFERPGITYLNRPLIMILEDRGVEKSAFTALQDRAVADIHMASDTVPQARSLFRTHGLGNGYKLGYLFQCFTALNLGFQNEKLMPLENIFIDRLIQIGKANVLRDIKNNARIPVPDSWHLVGVADEGPAYQAAGYEDVFCLKEGQIFACVQRPDEEPEYIQGPVVISRSPTVHPGDVQRVWAIGKPPEDKLCLFRNLRNVVVLPSVGERSLASMLGGGDLDGDLYSIIKESTLLPTEHCEAASYVSVGTREIDHECTIEDVCDFIVEYINSDVLGLLSDRHLIIADQSKYGTKDQKCLQLSELCSQAVDYSKNGIPVDMQRSPRRLIPYKPDWKQADETVLHDIDYYISTRALGELFRSIPTPQKPPRIPPANPNAPRYPPLSDSISAALREHVERHLGYWLNADQEVAEVSKLFDAYARELKYICLTHSLTDDPDDRLEEEEVVLGTIMANCTQHRYRQDRVYRMRLHSSVLARDIQRKIYEYELNATTGSLRYGLSQAWLAWDFGMRNRTIFGANSFALIALGVICNILEAFGDIDLKAVRTSVNDDDDDDED
ncbi:RNA-dependent RNA polymerase [Abortiporus biennis]